MYFSTFIIMLEVIPSQSPMFLNPNAHLSGAARRRTWLSGPVRWRFWPALQFSLEFRGISTNFNPVLAMEYHGRMA